MGDHLNKKIKCPHCGELNDGYFAISKADAEPIPGAVTVCAYCLSINVFKKDLTLREMEQIEIDELKYKYPETYVDLCRAIDIAAEIKIQRERELN